MKIKVEFTVVELPVTVERLYDEQLQPNGHGLKVFD